MHRIPHTPEARAKMRTAHLGVPNLARRRATRVVAGVEHFQCGGQCKQFFPRAGFYKDKRTILGLTSACKTCHTATNLRTRNQAKASESNRLYMQRRRGNKPEEVRAYERLWSGHKRAKRRDAIPKWLTGEQGREMREFYRNSPAGFHVDHIVPLRGRTAWGLHVPWNLQYLPASENLKKHNKLPAEVADVQ